MNKIFVSHTKKDEKFCDIFDRACARVGIDAFRSEFEDIKCPAWKTIKDEINNSTAVFFLVGKELVKSQNSDDPNWKFTQNWIAYEIGLACQKGCDVWAICDDVIINFPMPYINNYLPVSLRHKDTFNFFKDFILEEYRNENSFPFPYKDAQQRIVGVKCPKKNCRAEFNLHLKIPPMFTCPQCLKHFVLKANYTLLFQDAFLEE